MLSALHRHWLLATVSAFVVLAAVAAGMVPWQSLIEGRLKTLLEAQGVRDVELSLSHIGFKSISLEKITVGQDPPFTLRGITLNYSVFELFNGGVREILASGVDINVSKIKDAWHISGFETQQSLPGSPTRIFLPVKDFEIASIPIDRARLDKSIAHVSSNQWRMDLPLEIEWQKSPEPKLTAQSKGIVFKIDDVEARVGELTAALFYKPDQELWQGPWAVKSVQITGAASDIPELTGKGTIEVHADHVALQGQLENADRAYRAAFSVDYFLNEPEKSALKIIDARLPWMGGAVAAQQISLPFGRRQSLTINLKLTNVSVQSLLQTLTGKQTTATGGISGTLPVTIEKDGRLVFHQGTLQADEPGIVTLQPEAIPGDNQQVAFVREVMKNLHYTQLSVLVDNDDGHKLSVKLALAGRNPDVLEGRPVKINVHLRGDMLDFVQQNILLLTDPKNLLERGEHETK